MPTSVTPSSLRRSMIATCFVHHSKPAVVVIKLDFASIGSSQLHKRVDAIRFFQNPRVLLLRGLSQTVAHEPDHYLVRLFLERCLSRRGKFLGFFSSLRHYNSFWQQLRPLFRSFWEVRKRLWNPELWTDVVRSEHLERCLRPGVAGIERKPPTQQIDPVFLNRFDFRIECRYIVVAPETRDRFAGL